MAVYGWEAVISLVKLMFLLSLYPRKEEKLRMTLSFSFLLHHAYGNGTVVTLHFHVDKTRNPFYKLPIFLMSRDLYVLVQTISVSYETH